MEITRDALIVQAIVLANIEIQRRNNPQDCTIDMMHLATQYGARDAITFEEVDKALEQELLELLGI